jgi:DNA invertase Pin-like site-specific DNA recombinase
MTTSAVSTGRAAVYCRISEDDAGQGAGVADQEMDGQALCLEQGWEPTVFTDNDMSAAKLTGKARKQRPEFDKLLAAVARGEFDVIVCRDLSRLTRDPVQGITLISETWPEIAKRYGQLQVWYFGEDDYGLGINFVTGRGVKEARRSLNVAAEYVETISRNVRRAKLRHAVAGRPSGGWRPFGYEGDGKVRSIRESEAELVREAAQRVLSGDTTYTVAKDWNRRGNVSPRGGQWRPKSVRQMLTNPTIAGLRKSQGEVIGEAAWPAILDKATWDSVCAVLNADRGTVQTRRSYLLRGILKCECGRLMAGNSGRPRAARYGCKPYSEQVADRVGNHGGCGASIAADFVEQFVTEWAISALDAPGLTDAVMAETEADRAEIVRLTAENAADRNALAELSDDYYVHRVIPDKATFVRLSRELNERIGARESQQASIRGISILDRYAGHAREEWPTLDLDTQRSIISALIESVVAKRATTYGRGALTPDRLEVCWRFSAIREMVPHSGTLGWWAVVPPPPGYQPPTLEQLAAAAEG